MSLGYIEENETSLPPFGQLCRRFSLSEILSATHNFNEALIIGRGGFGTVYKGSFDDKVSTISAIKRFHSNFNQGAHEFWTEVRMLSKFHHCNLVSLIGYCNDNGEMVLVYEHMPCGTLEDHLHKMSTRLSWMQLLKVCIGAARGLDYLHTGTGIQHRDVKSSNILLDENFLAKVSDYGLSKVGPSDYANTNVKGSFEYLDPEYFLLGRLTRNSDVYSFGVVLFEVLCGRRAVDRSLSGKQQILANWVQNRIKEGSLDEIIDPSMQGRISPGCLREYTKIAEQCLHSCSKKRPSMGEVVVRLESALVLQEGDNTLTDVEMYNDSNDYDNQDISDYSFADGEHRNDAEVNDNQVNMESLKELEIAGVSRHEDEWIPGDTNGEQSYKKSPSKVTSSGDFDDQRNTKASLIKGKVIDEAEDCEDGKNISVVTEMDMLDADERTDSASDSGRGGGRQDMQTLSEASGGPSNIKHATKMTFTMKLKKIFFAAAAPGGAKASRKTNTNIDCSGSSKVDIGDVLTQNLKIFSFDELDSATQNFKQENILGKGEFGRVYKGWVDVTTYAPSTLKVGMIEIAVKRLHPGKVDRLKRLYRNRCIKDSHKLILEQLRQSYRHPNFVKLLGYCLEDKELLLVYEFMENGSLSTHLYERPLGEKPLPWFTRIKILLGAAEGLAFLHNTMKVSSNNQFATRIMFLDQEYNCKLSYFGLEPAYEIQVFSSSYATLVEFCDHHPYAPPETHRGEYDMMSDVFLFGVVLLETLTGMRKYTPDWKRNKQCLAMFAFPVAFAKAVDECDRRDIWSIVDSRLEHNYPQKGAVLLGQLAHRCLKDIPKDRPSMEQVLTDLERVIEVEMQTEDYTPK